MDQHDVVIAGGGPTGMMLACELALADVDVVVIERRVDQELDGSRAKGLHARTIEVLDQRGVAERFLSQGQPHPAVGFAHVPLDIADFPSRHPYVLALPQRDFERILAGWVDELGVAVRRGREVVDLAQDDDGVDVALSDGALLRTRHLVGCDGGRSVVRKATGIDFVGVEPSTSWLLAEVETRDQPAFGMRHDDLGTHAIGPAGDDGVVQVVLTERQLRRGDDPGMDELRDALVAVYGTDFGAHGPRWISRFTDMARQAATYRRGRVLLAGDAAHVHPPQGGQGLNTGVQDAVNLGWKLALVVAGTAPDSLLDTYEAERHPVAARVLRNTMAQVALGRPDERSRALRESVADLLAMDEPRRHVVGMVSGLDIAYDLGDGHPLLGRRVPDLDLATSGGPRRLSTLLHEAQPVMLDLAGSGRVEIAPWADRVRVVDAEHAHPEQARTWELPVLGAVPAPPTVLVRPDGHVAWVGEPDDPGLADALTTWFGPPTPRGEGPKPALSPRRDRRPATP